MQSTISTHAWLEEKTFDGSLNVVLIYWQFQLIPLFCGRVTAVSSPKLWGTRPLPLKRLKSMDVPFPIRQNSNRNDRNDFFQIYFRDPMYKLSYTTILRFFTTIHLRRRKIV